MTTTEAQNKAFVLKAVDALFNKRDYAAAERFWSPAYIQHSALVAPGREGLFEFVKAAPKELHYENALIVADGDYVMLHSRLSGIGQPVNWVVVDSEETYVYDVAKASLAVRLCGMHAFWNVIRADGAKIGVKPEDLDGKYNLQADIENEARVASFAGVDKWCDFRDFFQGPCAGERPGWLSGNGKWCTTAAKGIAEESKLKAAAAAAANAAKDAR